MLLKHYNGEHVVFDDFFNLDSRWISFAFLGVIKSSIILLGFICFIIPGIYLAMRFMFAELLVVEKGMRPIEALRASSEMTKGKGWGLILFMLVSVALIMLGFFVFLIGAVIAGVVVSFATIRLYRDLQIHHG